MLEIRANRPRAERKNADFTALRLTQKIENIWREITTNFNMDKSSWQRIKRYQGNEIRILRLCGIKET